MGRTQISRSLDRQVSADRSPIPRLSQHNIRRHTGSRLGIAAQSADNRANGWPLIHVHKTRQQLGRIVSIGHVSELHASDERQLVRDLGLERHQFADVHSWDSRLNGFELPSALRRRVRLQVVHVDMAGTAKEINHDDGLGCNARWRSPLSPKEQEVRQGQPGRPQHAQAKEAAPGDTVTSLMALGPE